MNLKVKHENTKDCKIKLHIDVPYEVLEAEYETVKKELSKQISLPGFRKGKIPLDIIEKKFQDSIKSRVIEKTLPKAYDEAIKIQKLKPFGQPVAENVSKYEAKKPLNIQISVDRSPSCKINYNKKVEIENNDFLIEEKDVEVEIKGALMKAKGEFEDIESVKDKDSVAYIDIDFLDPSLKNKSFKNQFISMDESLATDPFSIKKQLIGMKANESKTITKKIEKDYTDQDLAGKILDLEIKVIKVQKINLPKITDSLLKEMGYSSEENMRKELKTNLEKWATDKLQEKKRSTLIEEIKKNALFEIPKSAIKMLTDSYMTEFKNNFNNDQVALHSLLKEQNKTLEDFEKKYEAIAQENIKNEILISKLIEDQNIEITEESLEEEIKKTASAQNKPYADQRKEMIKSGAYTYLKNNLKKQETIDFLLKKVTLKKGKKLNIQEISVL